MGSRHPPRPCPQRWAETTVTKHTLREREGLSGKTSRQEEKKIHRLKRLAGAKLPLTLLRWTSLLFSPLGNSSSSSSLLGKAVLRPPLPGRPGLRSQQALQRISRCFTIFNGRKVAGSSPLPQLHLQVCRGSPGRDLGQVLKILCSFESSLTTGSLIDTDAIEAGGGTKSLASVFPTSEC